MPRQPSRSRSYVFTLNNFNADDVLDLRQSGRELRDVKYLVFGREIGESGTRHLQGYVQFKQPKSFAAAKRWISSRAHVEKANGKPWQAADYCKKDGDFEEFGVAPISPKSKGQKEKERWSGILKFATEGNLDGLAEEEPQAFIQHYSTLKRIACDYGPVLCDNESVSGVWYYGAPGVGKSRLARDRAVGVPYLKNCNKWWDGYMGHDTVIIDDFDKGHKVLGHHLKIWADRYAFTAEVKGSSIRIRPKHIIITSNYKIEEIFEDPSLIAALRRRFRVMHLISYNGEEARFE